MKMRVPVAHQPSDRESPETATYSAEYRNRIVPAGRASLAQAARAIRTANVAVRSVSSGGESSRSQLLDVAD